MEVMAGARPAPQVIRWTSPEVYAVLARRSPPPPAAGCSTRAGRSCADGRGYATLLDGVVEVSVVVVHPDRLRAMALRMAGVDHRSGGRPTSSSAEADGGGPGRSRSGHSCTSGGHQHHPQRNRQEPEHDAAQSVHEVAALAAEHPDSPPAS